MDEKYIIKNNQRMALLCGAFPSISFDGNTSLIIPGRGVILEGPRECKYHNNLEWIMDPIRKIISEGYEFNLKIGCDLAVCTISKLRSIDIFNHSTDLVEAIYKSVVDYLDEMDEKKSKE